MERKIFFGILGATLVALALAILLPGGRQADPNPKLPWQIHIDAAGRPTVLGITLGHTTLQQARDQFQEQGELNLFVSPGPIYSVEAYFQRLFLSGIRADLILTLAVDQATREGMYQRGLRISKLGSGDRRVDLTVADQALLTQVPVDHITYIPAIDLDEALITARFGEPERRIAESPAITHWLYPARGLDIAVNREGKEVIQYVNPAKFEQILKPLGAQEKRGETTSSSNQRSDAVTVGTFTRATGYDQGSVADPPDAAQLVGPPTCPRRFSTFRNQSNPALLQDPDRPADARTCT